MSPLSWTVVAGITAVFIFGCFFIFIMGEAMKPIPTKKPIYKDWKKLMCIPVVVVMGMFMLIPMLFVIPALGTKPKNK